MDELTGWLLDLYEDGERGLALWVITEDDRRVCLRQAFPALLDAIKRGVRAGGELLRAQAAKVIRAGEKNAWLEIVLDEGKNRHIRRMLEALNVEVLRLVRVAIGPLVLGELKKGTVRELTAEEKRGLDRALQGTQTES